MRQTLCPILLVTLTLAGPAYPEDGIPPDTLAAVKRATVYIKSQGAGWKGTGSGFVVSSKNGELLIATNHHVISNSDDNKTRPTPAELRKSLKEVSVSVVFDPGTKEEMSMKAEPIAADPSVDLAILRVAPPKSPPVPIPLPVGLKLNETMPVYVFGFPFGQMLATAKGAPAITIGKGSISSLRTDDTGELALIQIDGALNPGNSGGPVVDAKGRLIGVAVATLKASQGIGLTIPAIELTRVMKGRLGSIAVSANRGGPNSIRLHFEVDVIDPSGAVRGGTLHYVPNVVVAADKLARGETLAARPGAKSVPLKLNNGVAAGELILDSSVKQFSLQVIPDGGAGADGATPVRVLSLATGIPQFHDEESGLLGSGPSAPPPPGWKEFRTKDNSFKVMVPAKARAQREWERLLTVQGRPLKSNALTIEMATGLTYQAQQVTIGDAIPREARSALAELLCDLIAQDVGGRVTVEQEVKVNGMPWKEYRIESGRVVLRMRLFVAANSVYIAQGIGSKEQVESAGVETFLASCKIAPAAATLPPPPPGFPGEPGASALPPSPVGPGPGFPVGPGPGVAPRYPAAPGPGVTAGPVAPGWPGFPAKPGPEVGSSPIQPGPAARGRRTQIEGGFNDPEFQDDAPPGGVLVGLDIGLGQFFNNSVVHAIRPLFRVDGRDVPGQWHGQTIGKQFVSVVAKPGYAVGGVTVKTGITVDGLSITFMRVVDGRLDPRDSYDSPWVGTKGILPATLGGDGSNVVGLLGKTNPNAVTGFGLSLAEVAPPAFSAGPTPASPEGPAPYAPLFGNQPNDLAAQPSGPQRGGELPPGSAPQGRTPTTVTTPPTTPPAKESNRGFYFVLAAVCVLWFGAVIAIVAVKNHQSTKKRLTHRPRRRRG